MSEAKEPYHTARNLNLKVEAGLSGFSKFSVVIYFNFADDLYPMQIVKKHVNTGANAAERITITL